MATTVSGRAEAASASADPALALPAASTASPQLCEMDQSRRCVHCSRSPSGPHLPRLRRTARREPQRAVCVVVFALVVRTARQRVEDRLVELPRVEHHDVLQRRQPAFLLRPNVSRFPAAAIEQPPGADQTLSSRARCRASPQRMEGSTDTSSAVAMRWVGCGCTLRAQGDSLELERGLSQISNGASVSSRMCFRAGCNNRMDEMDANATWPAEPHELPS